MAPEQAEGRSVDARADVFAFGAVLYEMLSGQRAFQGSSPLSIMAAVLHDQPTPLSQVCAGIPPAPRRHRHALPREGSRPSGTRPQWSCAPRSRSSARRSRRPSSLRTGRVTRPVIAALVVVAAAGSRCGHLARRSARRACDGRARSALPQIEALVAGDQPDAAYRLLAQVQAIIPDDPQLARLTNDVMDPISARDDA